MPPDPHFIVAARLRSRADAGGGWLVVEATCGTRRKIIEWNDLWAIARGESKQAEDRPRRFAGVQAANLAA